MVAKKVYKAAPSAAKAAKANRPVADLSKIGVRTPKTRKGAMIVKRRLPQVRESPRKTIFLRANSASHNVINFLRDLKVFHKHHSVFFTKSKRLDIHPFEDFSPIQYLCEKNDCQAFCFGSSSKKHPFRVIAGRTFDNRMLDMYELDISEYQSAAEFKDTIKPAEASKPLVVCRGPEFEASDVMIRLRTFLFEFFGGPQTRRIFLKGIDHVVLCTALDPNPDAPDTHKVEVKHYRVGLKKGDGKLPTVALTEIGPAFTLTVGRSDTATSDAWQEALRTPSELLPKKVKNVTKGSMGETRGRIHIGQQPIEKMHTPHFHKESTYTRTKRKFVEAGSSAEED